MEEAPVQVKIPLFEGPLDLLLHLIRKHEVDIYDIPMVEITGQYLAYLDLMKSLNIDVAGEFLVMAATLIQIKSRMLLPQAPGGEEEEDPRLEITQPLLEYLRFKEAARRLGDRSWLERDVFPRGRTDEIEPPQDEVPLFNLGLFDLIDAFTELMGRLSQRRALEYQAEQVSLSDRVSELLEFFRAEEHLLFTDLFTADQSRPQLVVTFLAVLELARMGFLFVYQETTFGPIRLSVRREAFDLEDKWTI